uniref:Uncharacterized protein n=1 Tax=Heterorhabditis bacteriophora TaxID=37862 RepID=A0A1I7WBU5_HETBA
MYEEGPTKIESINHFSQWKTTLSQQLIHNNGWEHGLEEDQYLVMEITIAYFKSFVGQNVSVFGVSQSSLVYFECDLLLLPYLGEPHRCQLPQCMREKNRSRRSFDDLSDLVMEVTTFCLKSPPNFYIINNFFSAVSTFALILAALTFMKFLTEQFTVHVLNQIEQLLTQLILLQMWLVKITIQINFSLKNGKITSNFLETVFNLFDTIGSIPMIVNRIKGCENTKLLEENKE